MRIALVTEYYYPHLGGVTEQVESLARYFIALGHSPLVITPRMSGGGSDPDFVRRVGQSVTILSNGAFARVSVGWRLRAQIERILREERVEVVHVQGGLAPTLGLVAPEAARRLGIPVVATFHSWFRRSVAYSVFRRPLQRRLDRMDATIAVSEPAALALARYFHADWEIIPNGIDLDCFHPDGRSPNEALTGVPRILFLGRLDPRNGLDTVFAAMPRILASFPTAELVVAGDGPLRPYYQMRARRFGNNVRFVGRVYKERPSQYAQADLYVCPTERASFGITLLEAMACGTPMIVSDVTGFRELISGGGEAVLAPPGEPVAWADTAVRLLRDPKRRAAMASAGRAKAATYSWTGVAGRVLEVYQRVTR